MSLRTFPRSGPETDPDIARALNDASLLAASLRWLGPDRCLNLSIAFVAACHRLGMTDACLQGGSCFWPRSPEWNSSRETGDHSLGYFFDDENPETWQAPVREGRVPEWHVWAALPPRGVIVDMAAKFFPETCRRLSGKPWEYHYPEDGYAVLSAATLRKLDGVQYLTNANATVLALFFACEISHKLAFLGCDFPEIADVFPPRDIDFETVGTDHCPVRKFAQSVKSVRIE